MMVHACSDDASIVHVIAGRARLRLRRLRRDPAFGPVLSLALGQIPGVRSVRIAGGAASVIVEHDPRRIGIEAIVRAASALALIPPAPGAPAPSPSAAKAEDRAPAAISAAESRRPLYLSSAAILLAITTGGFAPIVSYPLVFVTSIPIFKRAWGALAHRRRLNIDLLDSLAVLAAVATGDVINATGIVWLVSLGDFIRDLTQARARRAIRDLLDYEKEVCWVVRGDTKVQIPVAEVVVGDVVVIYTGSAIPVDGIVVDGAAIVDQQVLTGESMPISKKVDDRCFAATVIKDGKLYIRADHVGADTKAASTVRLIEDAPSYETRMQNYAEVMADRLVGPALGCSALVYLVTADINRMAAILTIDFGTGPRVSAPTTVLSAMNAAARRGILFKGGAHIERLAKVSTVIFDKTGTLTRGVPEITDVIVHDRLSDREAVTLAAAASARQTHPVSQAVLRLAEAWALSIPERDDSSYLIGKGVKAWVNGRTVALGSARFLSEIGAPRRLSDEAQRGLEGEAKSLLFLAVDGVHTATLAYRDQIRAESHDLIRGLRARGVDDIVMLTGDSHAVAQQVSRELGITRFFAEMLPEGKAEMAQKLRKEGRIVAVVGDGINDSPAMSYADIGVSVSAGAEIAREAAGVVLMVADLGKLNEAIDIARGAIRIIRHNCIFTYGTNAVAYGLAIPGLLSPVLSTLVSSGSAVLTCLNGLRPLLWREASAPWREASAPRSSKRRR
jgi:heavy metal translocating P-type ATPase